MNIDFKGKRILVTGVGQGIGRDLALRLAKFNGEVIGFSRTQENLDKLHSEDPRIQTVCVDLSDWEAAINAVKSVLPIDMLVNNAGVAILKPFLKMTKEEIDKIYDINVKAVISVSQIVAENLVSRKVGGSIVNVSSQAGIAAILNHSIYCSSKAAVDMLTKNMALELGPHNIRVNSINPTVVMTEMGKLGWSDPAKASAMLSKIPLGRFAEVSEVVDAIVYLLSDRSSMINGVMLPVDGGFLAT
ncbi:L-xylulose reductase [Prorops nasuta]|uniref:L-xylulose reductase n=1 Tax=Prorops nasuta TaxID=863751 RepID=UPI0034CD203A